MPQTIKNNGLRNIIFNKNQSRSKNLKYISNLIIESNHFYQAQ